MKQRLVYISNARIIGILLVVFSHLYTLLVEISRRLDVASSTVFAEDLLYFKGKRISVGVYWFRRRRYACI